MLCLGGIVWGTEGDDENVSGDGLDKNGLEGNCDGDDMGEDDHGFESYRG